MKEHINLYCSMEKRRPFTLLHDEFLEIKDELLRKFSDSRRTLRIRSGSTYILKDTNGYTHAYHTGDNNLLTILSAHGYDIHSERYLKRLDDPDEFEAELIVISQVLAYFDLSSKRIIDVIPMIFEKVFAQHFSDELSKVLTVELELVGERGLENCARYAQEEPAVRVKREDLTRQRVILERALEVIARFFI
jgi:hypothetical protein